jgi:cytochrome bd-type quinol oxidase subunit 2
LNFLIHNKILIALAAVALAIETEIELGLSPEFQPYLLIIFFATIFEYNLQPAIFTITYATNQDDKKQQRKKLTVQTVCFLLIPALIVIVTFFLFINKNSQSNFVMFPHRAATSCIITPKKNALLFSIFKANLGHSY